MLAQRLLCVACAVGLGASTGAGERSTRELRPGDAQGRIYRPVIPRSPPMRVTNAHAGVELLEENVAALNERRRKAAPSPDLKKRPFRRARVRRPVSRRPTSGPFPAESSVNHRFARKIVEGTLKNVRSGARLISARGNFNVPLVNKLIDNATLIRENIVEGFSCDGRIYGYYADQLNECQIFHICVPMKQMFPNRFTEQDVYHFSFICPQYTIFSQDSMVCAWSQSAVPCSEAHHLYDMNKNFFVVSNDVPKETPTGGYPSAGGILVATGSPVTIPQYPGSGVAPVNPSPSPAAAPSPYPIQSGTLASASVGVPSPYPASGVGPVNPAPTPTGVLPAYPASGGSPVNPAPASTGVPPAYPSFGAAQVNPVQVTGGVPPAYPAPGGAQVNPAPVPAGVPPAYPPSGETSGNPVSGVAPVNPVPSIPASSVYPTPTQSVGPGSAPEAPLPNSRPLGEEVSSTTDSVDDTTIPSVETGSDATPEYYVGAAGTEVPY